jgi:ubiquitin-activating enzyme E1
VDEIAESLLCEFARESCAVICPTFATLAGIVGHEVLKAISGRSTPLRQFLAVGSMEALPPQPIKFIPQNNRSDPYRQIFGNAQQEIMQNLWYFMIGADTRSCKPLKNWTMIEVGMKGPGRIWLTDMDQIDRLNLSSQFLFRNTDIGQMKSVAAAQAAAVMNPTTWIEPQSNKVARKRLRSTMTPFTRI